MENPDKEYSPSRGRGSVTLVDSLFPLVTNYLTPLTSTRRQCFAPPRFESRAEDMPRPHRS